MIFKKGANSLLVLFVLSTPLETAMKRTPFFPEEYLRVESYLKVIPPHTAHVLYYDCADAAVFNLA